MRLRHTLAFLIGFAALTLTVQAADSKKNQPPGDRETVAKPMTEKQRKANEARLKKELETPYKKWLNEDVVYIITDEEKKAFKSFSTDEERQQFIDLVAHGGSLFF